MKKSNDSLPDRVYLAETLTNKIMIHLRKYTLLGSLAAVTLGGGIFATGVASAQPNNDSSGAEVLTRGPVHEAFAGTISYNPEAGIIVDRAPPDLIEEVPPEQRLEGDNVTWIPGYWAWDDDQNDFLWVSGIWRNLPPGREWVPGYWAATDGRHQWTSGYWEDTQTNEVSYLPEPPKSVESGPSVEATSNDQTWIPGNWVWRQERYAWRAGYWTAARENWCWTPSYYRWTHRGYVYVDGYWDYPVERRGVVFAPVHFEPAYVSRPNFSYSPLTVISLAVFTNHLFLRPNYGHYYFGDYYEPRYRDRGYYASYSYSSGRRGYDPIYAHERWENRNDRNWDRQRQDYFEYRRDHQDARPPRTWAMLNSRPQADRDAVAERFDRVVDNRGEGRQRFKAVDKQERERYVSQRQEIRKFGNQREQLETRGQLPPGAGGKNGGENRLKVDRSPVVARKSDRAEKDGGPPARLQPRDSDQAGNEPQKGRDDPSNPKKNKQGPGNREGEARNSDKSDPAPETRTKPGQKRDADPAQGKNKGQERGKMDPTPERNDKREGKRDADPTQERKGKTEGERQADPTPERKGKTEGERQADPTPERKDKSEGTRKADPTPDRKDKSEGNRKADPTPERKDKPEGNRKADPTPERKDKPEGKRQADPTPERKANPEPKRQANPEPKRQQEPERKANPAPKKQAEPEHKKKGDDKRDSASAPARKEKPQAERQETAKAKPQQPSRPVASAPTQERKQAKPSQENKGQADSRPQNQKAKGQDAESKKKKKDQNA
jgi:hypothetical protein